MQVVVALKGFRKLAANKILKTTFDGRRNRTRLKAWASADEEEAAVVGGKAVRQNSDAVGFADYFEFRQPVVVRWRHPPERAE